MSEILFPIDWTQHDIFHRALAVHKDASPFRAYIDSAGNVYIAADSELRPLGDVVISGDLTAKSIILTGDDALTLQNTTFEDLRFPLTRDKRGQSDKPDFDFTNIGLLFPQNDANEKAYMIAQFSHMRKNGSNIYPHIHYVQDEAQEPVWKMDYRWYNNGEDPTGSFTTITANTFIYTYTSGSILQMVTFPEIDGSGINILSSMMDIKLYRDDNVVSGDVLAKEFDIHYEIDTLGSRSELIK